MTVVVDTGAALALLDRDARDHSALRTALERGPSEWVLPWATLPEIDYLAATRLGAQTARAFREDIASGQFQVEGLSRADLQRAVELEHAHAAGAMAERPRGFLSALSPPGPTAHAPAD